MLALEVEPPKFQSTFHADFARMIRSSRASFQIVPAPTAAPRIVCRWKTVGAVGAVPQAVPSAAVALASARSCATGVTVAEVVGVLAGVPMPTLDEVAAPLKTPTSRMSARRLAPVLRVT